MQNEQILHISDGEPGASVQPAQPLYDAVRSALKKILVSHEFRASRRCQDFLRFVVENTLAGRAEILKERTIGIEAFGRPASYDPSEDATVRVKAGEVRKRLGLYYAGEGRADEIRIDLAPGGYVPEFSWGPPAPAALEPAPAPGAPALRAKRLRWLALGGVAALVVTAAGWLIWKSTPNTLDAFWSPSLAGTSPALICAAYVPVYAAPDTRREQTSNARDFVLLNDQFVGGGDLVAASRLSGMLARMGRDYQVRIGSEVSFQDLKSTPAILIGYSYTKWKEISRDMRYVIDLSKRPVMITDNGAPTNWFLPGLKQDRQTDEDYALVTRMVRSDNQAAMVELSGITQYGTEAAAELVTKPAQLADALRGAPAGWEKKNLQLVLHVQVISGTPAATTVVARYFW